ncbi:hypothetical protein EVAR_78222_1 [Eumeta japonica]|uniref:Uncharacterized protein n=1 Tax=Eumeta variegata TaxID=151549 RepID=A0A4C1T3P3_EUMVA|nr:hypothetical protein EVAR_78222_1 [Eumeta japonica]
MNLPLLITPNNEDRALSDLVEQSSLQILEDNYLNNITEKVIDILEEQEKSPTITEEEDVETSTTQQPQIICEKECEKGLNEHTGIFSEQEVVGISIEKGPEVTNNTIINEVNEEEQITQNMSIDAKEDNENEKKKQITKNILDILILNENLFLKIADAKKEWAKNKCKKLRLEGEQYTGYRPDSKNEKFKVLHDVMRPLVK